MKEHLQSLIDSSLTRHITRGSTIFYQGEVPRSACIISDGIVRVYSISSQGEEQTVSYLIDGEFFPSSWVFGKATSTMFFYEATTDCTIAYIRKDELLNYIHADPEKTKTVLQYYVTNYTASLMRINALEQPRAREKLMYTLLFLCQRYGLQQQDKVQIPFNLTHQNIASLVGLTRETTAAEMSRLKKQGIITYKQQRYTINKEKLLNILGEDNFADINLAE